MSDGLITPEAIKKTAEGFMASKYLFTASELGVFQQLAAGSLTTEEVAHACGVAAAPLRVVLDGLAALNILTCIGGRYSNSIEAQEFLSGGPDEGLRPLLTFWDQIHYPTLNSLTDAVRGLAQDAGPLDEERQRIFSAGVDADNSRAAAALAATSVWKDRFRILDLGGGMGTFLRPALHRHKHLSATLYESPTVGNIAASTWAQSLLRDRLNIVHGDFMADPIPDGHDIVLLGNVVHYFDHERNEHLLRRIRQASPTGTRIIVVDYWTDPSHTRPVTAALLAGAFLTQLQGAIYSSDEGKSLLQSTGWRNIEMLSLTGVMSALIAEAGEPV
ncbi:methyltransferase [Streptomyces chartreusis]|uniref:methyltransferase n=1 Tax=Streptomyces chartreusis TaxID=1969 RepID=UPI0033FDE909